MEKRSSKLSLDLLEEERKWIHIAAAMRDISIKEYVLNAIRVQLANDPPASAQMALSAKEEPMLAEL